MLSPIDTAVVVGVALLVFGPKKFPEIGKSIGEGLHNFKKALSDSSTGESKPPEKIEPKKISEEAVASNQE